MEPKQRKITKEAYPKKSSVAHPEMTAELLERYLNLLGVQKRKPCIDALHELVEAQLLKIPFENVSKLYYKKHLHLQGLPGLRLYLDGIEHFHFGGTCYSCNYFFYQLLANLGYQIRLCGADMLNPDVHLVSLVSIEQQEYLIDVGYAAPFLHPLPRDLTTDHTIILGRDQYVLKPQDTHGHSRMELYRDGRLKHGYTVNPAPRQIQEFKHVIRDSYQEDSTFMNALLLVRFFPDRSLVLHNLTLIESQGSASKIHKLDSRDDFVTTACDYFGISREFTMDVVRDIGHFEDAWH